jgi:hypothetical protein
LNLLLLGAGNRRNERFIGALGKARQNIHPSPFL